MTRSRSESVSSVGLMKYLNSSYTAASYGVLRARSAVLIAAIMFVLVFVGSANACHHSAETAEQTSTEVPKTANEKAEIEA